MSELVGQALVTDPGGAAGGGYTLVASSPTVDSEDADFLAGTSQVTDFLHVEEAPGPFLSLYDLPSGARALTRRFVHGKRRGDYHRVVAHTLVIPEAVLTAVAWNPWQLLGKDRFCLAGGNHEPVSFPALGTALAEETPKDLDDLVLVPPSDPLVDLVGSLIRRRQYLFEAWDEQRLRARLVWTLETLVAGNRPLLPQTKEEEQLLALAWLLLPVVDRRRIRWTTHLAVSAEDLFQLANAPSSRDLVDVRPGGWRAPLPKEGVGEPSRSVATLADSFLGEDASTLSSLATVLIETRHSLFTGGVVLRREIAARGLLKHLPAEGHATVAALHAALRKVRVTVDEAVEESGLSETMVLRSAAATARNVVLGGHEKTTPVVREIQRSLEERLRLPGLLQPRVVLEQARGPGDAALLPWAVALVIDRVPPPPAGTTEREALAEILLERSTLRQSHSPEYKRQETLRFKLLAELTADLLRCRSGKALAALAALTQRPQEFLRVSRNLREANDPEALLAVVELVRRKGHQETAADVVREDLVPLLANRETLPPTVRPGQVRHALGSLVEAPKTLGKALEKWRGDLFDVAVDELRDWPQEPATEAVSVFSVADGSEHPGLPERRSLVGLAAHLAERGLPASGWLPFAIVEAAYLDREGFPAERDSFVTLLRNHRLEDADSARAVLAAVARPDVPARGCHRALTRSALPALPQVSSEAERDLVAVLKTASPRELVAWSSVVIDAAAELEGSAGKNLRWRWWILFVGRLDEAPVPREATVILSELGAPEKLAAVKTALPRLPFLGESPEVRELLRLFRSAAAARRNLAIDLETALVHREVRLGRLPLDLAVSKTYELAWRSDEQFRSALVDLLPSVPVERASTLFDLVRSPRVWPGAKAFITRQIQGDASRPEVLEHTLDSAGDPVLDRLPRFEELADDGVVLLTVARFAGAHWEAWPQVVDRLLGDALAAERADYAAAFLNVAEGTRGKDRYLQRLAEDRNFALLRQLSKALNVPWGRDLMPHCYRIRRTLEQATRRSGRTWKR